MNRYYEYIKNKTMLSTKLVYNKYFDSYSIEITFDKTHPYIRYFNISTLEYNDEYILFNEFKVKKYDVLDKQYREYYGSSGVNHEIKSSDNNFTNEQLDLLMDDFVKAVKERFGITIARRRTLFDD